MKHTILFLAANPLGTDPRALDREARAIQLELERSGFRDRFELVTRWAAEPIDLLRELRKLKPTVVHFSGHGTSEAAGQNGDEQRHGLFFQGPDGRRQLVSTEALEETFGSAGASVKLVVLSACYSDVQARALLPHVGCVVGMSGAIRDDAAQSFAIGFYGGLGERESIATAYKQGCAAISLEGLRDRDRPQFAVRAGVDASKLILAADPVEPRASGTGVGPAATSRPDRPGAGAAPSNVDIGILTIRDDEFRAVLAAFSSKAGIHKGQSREYTLRHADAGNGERYTVAVLRQVEQGHGEAQTAARDLIDDLAPRLVLVVGIAGGLPSDDVTLGDVVVSTRIHDFTVEARKAGQEPAYAVAGGPIDKTLAAVVANLAAREDELGDWTADLPPQPPVTWTRKGQLYGPPEWRRELRDKLEHHHGEGATPRAPVYATGPIASSDRLVKDPALLIPWLQTARSLLAIEMESGGVYRAVRERCPMLAIRSISDVVGLKRADAWTKFACASAAAFTRAFLRTRPIPPDRNEERDVRLAADAPAIHHRPRGLEASTPRNYLDLHLGAPKHTRDQPTTSGAMKPVASPTIHLNVWFPDHQGTEMTLTVGVATRMRVNLAHRSRAGTLASDRVSNDATQRFYEVAHVDVIAICPGADVWPLRARLPLPPDANAVASFEITPRRAGQLELAVILLIEGESIHQTKASILASIPTGATMEVPR